MIDHVLDVCAQLGFRFPSSGEIIARILLFAQFVACHLWLMKDHSVGTANRKLQLRSLHILIQKS